MPTLADPIRRKGRGKRRPIQYGKGRQLDPTALDEVRFSLGDLPRRRDLLIEALHRLQDRYGSLRAHHLAALAAEMRLAQAEVYEVATFYAHFDVILEGEVAPPPLTVRVCESISCALEGSHDLKAALEAAVADSPTGVRVVGAPCMGGCDRAPAAMVGRQLIGPATADGVISAIAADDVGAKPPPECRTFAAYVEAGGYQGLKAVQSGAMARAEAAPDVRELGLEPEPVRVTVRCTTNWELLS